MAEKQVPAEQEKPPKPLTPKQILDKLVAGEITQDQAKAELDKREEAKAKKRRTIEFGWGEKGAAFIRGLRKFPISLYPAEVEVVELIWEQFLDYVAAGPVSEEKPQDTEVLVVGELQDGVFTPSEEDEEDEAAEAAA